MLCSAIILWTRTRFRLRYRRKAAEWHKARTWRTAWRRLLFAPNIENYNAELCLRGPLGIRKTVKMLPGKNCRHKDFHSRRLERAFIGLQRRWPFGTLYPFPRLRAFYYIYHKLRNISEHGGVHHLCESTSPKVRLLMFAYMNSIHAERYTPGLDLARSNLDTLDLYYVAYADFLSRDPWLKVKRHLEQITGLPMLIEYSRQTPGVIHIHPVGALKHTAKPAAPKVGGESLTKWVLGHAIAGEKGAEIAIDIRKLINRTHFLGLGVSGSGKTNAVGLTLDFIGKLVAAGKWVERAYFLDPSGGAGLEEYAANVNFAVTMPDIHRAIFEIATEHKRREGLLPVLNRSSWPIGETIDGVHYGAWIVVFDEAQQFLNDKETIGGMTPAEILGKWARELRKYGMVMIIYTQAARANQGVPIALTQNCMMRLCFAHKDEDMATTFFNCSPNAFDVPPWEMTEGQFVVLLPGQHSFLYGKTDLAPHEIREQALKKQRGW